VAGETIQPPPAGPPFLLDTHIWLWHVGGSERLPVALRRALDDAQGDVWLSPFSVWEATLLHARGRLTLVGGARTWVESALRDYPVKEAAVTTGVALRAHEIDLGHRDPADHLLAATALVYGLTLVTVDERLVAAPWLPTLAG